MSKKRNYHDTTVHSVSEFVTQLETRILDRYRITLFRGQNTDKALIPKIARHYFKKSRKIDEKRMLEDFSTNSIAHLDYEPKNILEKLTIAQHHGIPTRLLDWTENALTALYFATYSETSEDDTAVVWVLSLERDSELLLRDSNVNPFAIDEIKVFKPANIIQRISSQHGWFSIHPYKGQGFFERIENIEDESVRISKVIIPRENINEINKTLDSCGINEYTIFRDLDSLGKYVFHKYKQ